MALKVFISYRRDDSAGHAGRVHDRLQQEFGRDDLFMDVDDIPLGDDFVKVLREEVAKCDVLLAIIGPGWVDARDEDGNRRVDNPNDFVRIEIATALKRKILVIPILLEGTRVPKAGQLPDDLSELALRNGLDVRHASFNLDIQKLIRRLKQQEQLEPLRVELNREFDLSRVHKRSAKPPQQLAPAEPALPDRYRAEERIKVDATIVRGAPDGWFLPGNGKVEWFQDHEMGPEMVVAPESHLWEVSVDRPFAVGRHAVTRGQFAAFVDSTGYKIEGGAFVPVTPNWTDKIKLRNDPEGSWRNPGFPQDDSHPVVCASWKDAKAFAEWLSSQTGRNYQLLTEAEWEYVTRAETKTPFWWGSTITVAQANYNGNYALGESEPLSEWRHFKTHGAVLWRKQTLAVDEFAANPWGLYQVHGNVWEWCEEVSHENSRVICGGSWADVPDDLRVDSRKSGNVDLRVCIVGFRVKRDIP